MNRGGKAEKENTANEANLQEEAVQILFVSGLPLDIKPRELYLLFRPFKGYEGSLIKLTSKRRLCQFRQSLRRGGRKEYFEQQPASALILKSRKHYD